MTYERLYKPGGIESVLIHAPDAGEEWPSERLVMLDGSTLDAALMQRPIPGQLVGLSIFAPVAQWQALLSTGHKLFADARGGSARRLPLVPRVPLATPERMRWILAGGDEWDSWEYRPSRVRATKEIVEAAARASVPVWVAHTRADPPPWCRWEAPP